MAKILSIQYTTLYLPAHVDDYRRACEALRRPGEWWDVGMDLEARWLLYGPGMLRWHFEISDDRPQRGKPRAGEYEAGRLAAKPLGDWLAITINQDIRAGQTEQFNAFWSQLQGFLDRLSRSIPGGKLPSLREHPPGSFMAPGGGLLLNYAYEPLTAPAIRVHCQGPFQGLIAALTHLAHRWPVTQKHQHALQDYQFSRMSTEEARWVLWSLPDSLESGARARELADDGVSPRQCAMVLAEELPDGPGLTMTGTGTRSWLDALPFSCEIMHELIVSGVLRLPDPPGTKAGAINVTIPGAAVSYITPQPSAQATLEEPAPPFIFCKRGDQWQIAYAGKGGTFNHLKGYVMIAHLLRNPYRWVDAVELVQLTQAGTATGDASGGQVDVDVEELVEGFHIDGIRPLDDQVDPQTMADLRSRLAEIDDEMKLALMAEREDRVQELQDQKDQIIQYVKRATGPGGRRRPLGTTASNRARVNAKGRITAALGSIGAHLPELRQYLERTIKTGVMCCYKPDPHDPVVWVFE